MSIYPDEYCGILISALRRQQMGNCLYQILQNPEVIPMEFTWARNIVARFVEENNGYRVLYAMVEPILTNDDVIEAPISSECNDLNEYATCF